MGVGFGWVGLLVLWEFGKSEFCWWGLDSGSGRGAGVDRVVGARDSILRLQRVNIAVT